MADCRAIIFLRDKKIAHSKAIKKIPKYFPAREGLAYLVI